MTVKIISIEKITKSRVDDRSAIQKFICWLFTIKAQELFSFQMEVFTYDPNVACGTVGLCSDGHRYVVLKNETVKSNLLVTRYRLTIQSVKPSTHYYILGNFIPLFSTCPEKQH